jgi:hypothetical protein
MNLCADRNVRRGVDDTMWRDSDASLVIRTDFDQGDEWQRIQAEIVEPQTESGFVAGVEFVDDRRYEKLTVEGLLQAVPGDSVDTEVFLVDTFALTHPDRPILVVNRCDRVESPKTGVKGRCTVLHSASSCRGLSRGANLLLGNMDWEEFADKVGHDGIFRGFE